MSHRGSDRGRGAPPHGGPRGGGPTPRGASPDRGRGGGYAGRGGGGGGDRGRGGGFDRGRGGGFDRGRGGGGGFDRGRGGGRGGRPVGGVFLADVPATVDARLSDSSDLALVQSFRSVPIQSGEIPLRPDYGTVGRPIKLRANFFPVRVRVPDGAWFEYDVSITPVAGTAARRVKKRIFHLAEQSREWTQYELKDNVAHDYSAKLIAAKKLRQPLNITVVFHDEDEEVPKPKDKGYKEYTLSIKFVQNLDKAALASYLNGDIQYRNYDIFPLISAMNLILATHPNRPGGGVMVGRNRFFFPTENVPSPLGGGLEAFRGFFSSVRPAHKQLMVNVNVCTTAFYVPGNLADAIDQFTRSSFGARATAFAKGVRVKAMHLGYKKTVKRVADKSARQYTFECSDFGGQRVSVEQYFKRKYNITLRYPELPLVDVGGTKANFLPAELCEILPGQAFKGKLTDEHTSEMIRVAAQPPNVNGNAIVERGLAQLGYNTDSGALKGFGLSIGKEMAVVPGRILAPPGIEYAKGRPDVDDSKASWNLRNVKFKRGATLKNWAVLLIRDGNRRTEFDGLNDPQLRPTVQGFAGMCTTSGMQVADAPEYVEAFMPPKNAQDPTRFNAITVIDKALKTLKRKPTIVLVLLSSGDKHIYAGIKHLMDVHLDIGSVCVQSEKIRSERGQLQYFANVALKFNMKLGGINHSLDARSVAWLNEKPIMLVGVDVTHPGPGSVKGTPSVSAVVASIDNQFAQFPASMRIQETKKEMVTEMEDMMVERLKAFQGRNQNKLPDRILVYRDGVSEGQFKIVREDELPSMKRAFKRFGPKYSPKLSIVICGKRHHTRFYPTEAGNAANDGNPRPGTVVDRGVTAVYEFDFFLQAHGGLQGTTRPTHYYVVHDENQFNADRLQQLTNSVSYMFARATKAVSLVSPAYYADLACERGRCYLHRLLQGLSNSASTSASGASADEAVMKEASQMWRGGVSGPQLSNTMYYL
ncbi:unnamed protein product [Mycena citricolor]|uniref:Argonaute-like protein n=1 Tax=Mycena citricolor TaxID=2018698 RepID=A0AAD2GYC6_9AGAR|nr:unnamed protein product [Mycena citricolor]